MAERKCIGYGENGDFFDCPNTAGTPWTPHWCDECDERRKTRITLQLEQLQSSAWRESDG